jgi:DNA-binding beta-propeller fold protein YncE
MSDRFDFLELGDEKPQTAALPLEGERSSSDTGWRPPPRLRAVELIGSQGTGAGEFNAPTALAADPWGAIYVTDSNNHRIQRVTPNERVFVFGRPGEHQGQLWGPCAVAVHPSGQYFFVAEQGNNRVQYFRFDNGQSVGIVGGLRMPSGVAFDAEGMLWIADTGNGRVLRFNPQSGQFICTLDRTVGILRPISIACDRAMNLFVTDGVTSDVTCYSLSGARVHALGELRKLGGPRQVAIDARGGIYLTESEANRLHVFDPAGNSVFIFDNPGTKLGALRGPSGITITPHGEVYLADTLNHRVLRLEWQ